MGALAVFAKLTAHPGRRTELLVALEPLIRCAIDEEPGTEIYAVHLDTEQGDAVWFYEIFGDTDALDAHASNETRLSDVGAKVGELLAGPVELSWGTLHRT